MREARRAQRAWRPTSVCDSVLKVALSAKPTSCRLTTITTPISAQSRLCACLARINDGRCLVVVDLDQLDRVLRLACLSAITTTA